MPKSYEHYLPAMPFKASRVYGSVNEAERAYWRARGAWERALYGSPSQPPVTRLTYRSRSRFKTGKDLKKVIDRYYEAEANYYATRLAFGPSFSSGKKLGASGSRPWKVYCPELPFGLYGVIPKEVAEKVSRASYASREAAEKAAWEIRESELERLGFEPDEYEKYLSGFEGS